MAYEKLTRNLVSLDQKIANHRFVSGDTVRRRNNFLRNDFPIISNVVMSIVGDNPFGITWTGSVAVGLAIGESDDDTSLYFDISGYNRDTVLKRLNRYLGGYNRHINFIPMDNVLIPYRSSTPKWAFQATGLFGPPLEEQTSMNHIYIWRAQLIEVLRDMADGIELWEMLRDAHQKRYVFYESQGIDKYYRVRNHLIRGLRERQIPPDRYDAAIAKLNSLRAQTKLPSFDEVIKLLS